MASGKTSEPVFNAYLAIELRRLNPEWRTENAIQSETTQVISEQLRRPDILITPRHGVAVCIETEWFPALSVEKDAQSRLGADLIGGGGSFESVLAVKVDKYLSTVDQQNLGKEIRAARFEFCLFTLDSENQAVRWPIQGWVDASLSNIADAIEFAVLSESRLTKAVDIVQLAIQRSTGSLYRAADRAPDMLPDIAALLHQQESEQTIRMSMAILANAFMQHSTLSGLKHPLTGRPVRSLFECPTNLGIKEEWEEILKINYWPIFKVASEILRVIRVRPPTCKQIIRTMIKMIDDLIYFGVTTIHDMAGKVFQRMIADRKFLATFYTKPTSALLLSELCADRLSVDWNDTNAIKSLYIADFACGTGTLLSAAYQSILRRVRRTGFDDGRLHRHMMVNSLIGVDIMPSAVNLAASILIASHPHEYFGRTRVILLPYGQTNSNGVNKFSIGSLDLILEGPSQALFSIGAEISGTLENTEILEVELEHENCDLIVMNPPFVRPTGNEAEKIGVPVPAFAGLKTSEDEQRLMSRRLKKINHDLKKSRSKRKFSDGSFHPAISAGNGLAGLASNFIDLAHEKLKVGGVLALVLPFSFVQGKSWEHSRDLLSTFYEEIKVLSIATSGSEDRAFSADTGMAEVIVIATKKNYKSNENQVQYINLLRRPSTPLEAAAIAARIHGSSDKDAVDLRLSENASSSSLGCIISSEMTDGGCSGIQSSTVASAMLTFFNRFRLKLPRMSEELALSLVKLADIGQRGLHHANISWHKPQRPFKRIKWTGKGSCEYPALWAHDAKLERQLNVLPDTRLKPHPDFIEKAVEIWNQYSSRFHLNRDFRLNSQPLAACITHEKSIGGRAWPNFLFHNESWEIPLSLWMNTTIGLMSFWWIGTRQQLGRVSLSLTNCPELVALDPRRLSDSQIALASEIFNRFVEKEFLPANQAYEDKTRQELDQAILVELLGLSQSITESLSILRYQWCSEPSVHGGKSTRP